MHRVEFVVRLISIRSSSYIEDSSVNKYSANDAMVRVASASPARHACQAQKFDAQTVVLIQAVSAAPLPRYTVKYPRSRRGTAVCCEHSLSVRNYFVDETSILYAGDDGHCFTRRYDRLGWNTFHNISPFIVHTKRSCYMKRRREKYGTLLSNSTARLIYSSQVDIRFPNDTSLNACVCACARQSQ